jgi:outer membrane protein OmpA-like peptidoglycan-associated protein
MLNDYNTAAPLFLRLLESDASNCYLNYKAGLCLLNIPIRSQEALKYLVIASTNVSNEIEEGSLSEKHAPIEAYFYLGKAYLLHDKFDDAKYNFELFKQKIDPREVQLLDYANQAIASCDIALSLKSNPIPLKIDTLPEPLNGSFTEGKALISADGSEMIFMSNRNGRCGVFVSQKQNGEWQKPLDITDQLGIVEHFYICSLSADGLRLYLFDSDEAETDLYVAEKNDNGWSKVRKLNKNINTKYLETHACESTDGQTLYFTSSRKRGYGSLDIYSSQKMPNGDWGEAVNLGKEINTPYNEETPFISYDGSILYFSSQGHYNMGGYDVFQSTKMDDSKWAEPQNVGYPINSTADDMFFVPMAEKNKALFCLGNCQDLQDRNISIISFYKDPSERFFSLKGLVSQKLNGDKVPDAYVYLLDNKGDTVKRQSTNSLGAYSFEVNAGDYRIGFTHADCEKVEKNVSISFNQINDKVNVDAILNPVIVAQTPEKESYIAVHAVFFDYNSSEIDRAATTELERITRILSDYPDLKLEISGFTDSKGSVRYNQKLSESRANNTKKYLVGQGVDSRRLITRSYGETLEVAQNQLNDGSDNPDGRKFNRRVELRILNGEGTRVLAQEIEVPESLRVYDTQDYMVCLLQGNENQINNYVLPSNIDAQKVSRKCNGHNCWLVYDAPMPRKQAFTCLRSLTLQGADNAFIVKVENLNLASSYNQTAVNKHVNSNYYCIQVAALAKPISVDKFADCGDVLTYKGDDGLTRYYVGNYSSKSLAKEQLSNIKQLGYSDAFIVPISRYSSNSKVPSYHRGVYTIQIITSYCKVSKAFLSKLPNWKASKGNDPYIRYSTGEFDTWEEAQMMLRKIHQLGYSDAFVRRISEIPGY